MGGSANAIRQIFLRPLRRITGLTAGIVGGIAFLAASCSTVTGPNLEANAGALRLEPAAVTDLPGWNSDDQFQSLKAFALSCKKMKRDPWTRICASAATALNTGGNNAARAFFQTHFEAYRLRLPGQKRGFLTGYFQPSGPESGLPSVISRKKINDLLRSVISRTRDGLRANHWRIVSMVTLSLGNSPPSISTLPIEV